jgi:hypothetical protein
MTPSELKIRFDELCAGRALGDLTMEEERELAALCKQLDLAPDAAFDLLAAAMEVDAHDVSGKPCPHIERAAASMGGSSGGAACRKHHPAADSRMENHRPQSGHWMGRGSCDFDFLIVRHTGRNTAATGAGGGPLALAGSGFDRAEIRRTRRFQSSRRHGDLERQLQQGYMTLSGIPANDPTQAQYQLWIVDPARDADAPVDGGVFDIPADGSPVVIPIAAKLALNNPQAFVITLEQPGGVVKSKQEKVVALAKS